ncbi:MAG: ABC transporter ATP-binding protein [Prevotellaceae bacterium]|jgi:iron complex transport system ATP-binding protein|nr:ABC transporter ATP-binding protein [Prevotellaceae bacterium]
MKTLSAQALAIGYRRGKTPIIVQQNINVELHAGEVVCLIGTNGCGKSTLLRTLGGLQKPLAGNVFINDKDFTKLSNAEKSLLMGLVLTEQVSVGKLTVSQMVSLGRYPHTDWVGKLTTEDEEKIAEAIALVHLQPKAAAYFDELSDGERQRVMIAKALSQDTPIILLDEPTAHLDLPNRVEMMLLLRRLATQTGKSILLSTHELDLALQTANRIWLMTHEKILCGQPEELVANGSFQAVFHNKAINFDEKGRINIAVN